MRALIFDVEANGTPQPQVCQLAYLISDGARLEARNFFFRVSAMNPHAYKVHHLSMKALDKLSGGRTFADHAREICRDFYWAEVYIGHGVSGDMDYLRREFERLALALPERRRFCTMRHFTGRCGGELPGGKPKPPSLSELWTHYGLTEPEIAAFAAQTFGAGAAAHDARFDAAATYLALRRAQAAGELPRGVLDD